MCKIMAKNWWFKFEYRVWQSDPSLSQCSLGARGFWLEILCAMYAQEVHTIAGSLERIARMTRCESAEVAKFSLELKEAKVCDVTICHGDVTLTSRRLKKELSTKENNRLRKQKERCRNDVTIQSKSKSKSNKKEEEKERPLSEQKKATRLPNDFIATEELLAWAKVKRPTIDPSLETEKFINYWTAKSGKDATKLDWNATWRNWILNAKESSNGSYYQQREQTVINERNAINQLRDAVKEISGDDAHHSPRQLLGFSENGYNG